MRESIEYQVLPMMLKRLRILLTKVMQIHFICQGFQIKLKKLAGISLFKISHEFFWLPRTKPIEGSHWKDSN